MHAELIAAESGDVCRRAQQGPGPWREQRRLVVSA